MKEIIKVQNVVTNKASMLFLRAAVVVLGLIAIGLGVLILPAVYSGWEKEYPNISYLKYPVLVILTAAIVPYFVALYQTLKLLNYIDTSRAFSMLSVEALRKIRYSGFTFSILFIIFLPIMYMIAQAEDAPGLVIIGMIMAGAPMVIAVFAMVLEKLLESAIEIKTENDLTV